MCSVNWNGIFFGKLRTRVFKLITLVSIVIIFLSFGPAAAPPSMEWEQEEESLSLH